jgi:hypothetical protein
MFGVGGFWSIKVHTSATTTGLISRKARDKGAAKIAGNSRHGVTVIYHMESMNSSFLD